MDVVLNGLTVNGMDGYRMSRNAQVILLESGDSRISLVRHNINSVAYQRIHYPIFLYVMALGILATLISTLNPRPSIGEYEMMDWYWWALIAVVSGIVYAFVKSAAVVVASGTVRTVLRGNQTVMLHAFEALQP